MSGYSLEEAKKQLKGLAALGKSVDMTRGRPFRDQLDISLPMLDGAASLQYTYDGGDARNYGDLMGVPAARALFADIFGVSPQNVLVLDGSSLAIMYKLVATAYTFGIAGCAPWSKQGKISFLCPCPGYDRHFAICEEFGINMIPVAMDENGPDMDTVERLVRADESIKGMWCVPKYSNPTGIVYSDETVKRIAALKPAAKDFRVIWDNAYIVHSLYDDDDRLLNIFDLIMGTPNEDMVYEVGSTSKITFAGSGIAALASSAANLKDFTAHLKIALINPNKVNQVMHVSFLKDAQGVREVMKKHAALLRPKFELVDAVLEKNFANDEDVKWSKPRGGYFVSLDVRGVAGQVVAYALSAGVKFTAAGSTYPYHMDPSDSNIRIAPSVPTLDELDFAMRVLVASIKLALAEKRAREE